MQWEHKIEPRSLSFSMLPSKQDVLPGSVNHPSEAEQNKELMSEPKLCYCENEPHELDELDEPSCSQSERVSYEVLDWVTREHDYYSREFKGQWNYENAFLDEGHEHDFSEMMDLVIADEASAANNNFEIPVIFDYTEVVCQDESYVQLDCHGQPIHLQTSQYPENLIYERPCYMDEDTANFDYDDQTQDGLRWIANQDCDFLTETRENPHTYTKNYVPATKQSLDHEFTANRPKYGNVISQESNSDSLDWTLGAEGWNLLDIPSNLPRDSQAMDQLASDHRLMSESQIQCTSSLGNLSGPCGAVNLENSKQDNLSEMEKDSRVRRRRKRSKMSVPPENVYDAHPEAKLIQLIRESELLATYRPILPKLPEPQNHFEKKADEDTLYELRKKRRGWKCCSQTFDDYNFYKIHIESVHGHKDGPSETKPSADQPTQKKPLPRSSVLCAFCSTNHDMLGPDVATKPRWNGLSYLICPLCIRWFKTLKQLKIHFCQHFRVKVNDNAHFPCRYCDRRFVMYSNLRKHEALCLSVQKSEEERRKARLNWASEAVAISAVSSAATPAAAARKASPKAAAVSTAVATISPASSAVSAAATPPAKAKSTARNERLFYCPDCGKLFAWESSVRRHQMAFH